MKLHRPLLPLLAALALPLVGAPFLLAQEEAPADPPPHPTAPAPEGEEASDRMTYEIPLDAPLAEVWDAFTTNEGLESWMVPHANVDLRVGGAIRTNYQAAAEPDHPGTITHNLLLVADKSRVVIRTDPPANRPDFANFAKLRGIWEFEALAPDRTLVRLESIGWGTGEDWDQMKGFMRAGNAITLQQLRKRFPDRERPHDALALLRNHAGTWEGVVRAAGRPDLHGRVVVDEGPGPSSALATGYLGLTADKLQRKDATQVWRDTETGVVHFQSISADGSISRGELRAPSADRIRWIYFAEDPADPSTVESEQLFTAEGAYELTIHVRQGEKLVPFVKGSYSRAEDVTESE